LSEQAGPSGEEHVSIELGERVRAIVAAAESMAAAVRRDAEQYAERRRSEADSEAERALREARERADRMVAERLERIGKLSDRIVDRSDAVLQQLERGAAVRSQLDEVVRALGETAERVADEAEELGPGPRSAEPEPEPAAADEPAAHEELPLAEEVAPLRPPGDPLRRPPRAAPVPASTLEERDARLEDARLVALQMAVAGRSREEVDAHLRQAFEVQDPGPILDHIFAEGFPGGERR
jgi:hypothetical protein